MCSLTTFQPTSVLPPENMEALAVLQALVQSTHELNVTDLDPVLKQISNMIRAIQPDAVFKLTVQNITKA